MRKAFFVLVFSLLLVSCTPKAEVSLGGEAFQKIMASPHETVNIQAKPDEETKLELSDGARVIVPAGAASQEVEIVLERNPDKAKNMPALGEYTVPVSSFYNIEPKGEGLVGPVEVQLPVDRSLIPKGMDGELVALFPNGKGGWRSEPVDEVNGKAVVYTDDLGDPIIAWNLLPKKADAPEKASITLDQYFTNKCKSKTFLGIGMDSCIEKEYQNLLEEMKKATPLCEPRMALQAVAGEGESGSQVQVIGQVASPYGKILQDAPDDAFANLPVEIKVNYHDVRETPKTFQVNTDSEGRFELTLDAGSPDSGLKEGWNWIFANATCPAGNDYAESESKGYAEFKLLPQVEEAAEPTPAAEPTQPPEGAVAIPDVIGLSLDEAIAKLGALGFRTTWVDGKSSMGLGVIFDQQPPSGKFYPPNRTTVVMKRTVEIEQISDTHPVDATQTQMNVSQIPDGAYVIWENSRKGFFTACFSKKDEDTVTQSKSTTLHPWGNAGIPTITYPESFQQSDSGSTYISEWKQILLGVEVITIGNRNVNAYKYSGKYNKKDDDRIIDEITEETIEEISYYDTKYGVLLKIVHHYKLDNVSNCEGHAYGLYTGGTNTASVIETNLDLDWLNE